MCELPSYQPFQHNLGNLGLTGRLTELSPRILDLETGHIRTNTDHKAERPREVLLEGQALIVPHRSVVDRTTAERIGAMLREMPFAFYLDNEHEPDMLENYTAVPPYKIRL
jgi:hypothetical protein